MPLVQLMENSRKKRDPLYQETAKYAQIGKKDAINSSYSTMWKFLYPVQSCLLSEVTNLPFDLLVSIFEGELKTNGNTSLSYLLTL